MAVDPAAYKRLFSFSVASQSWPYQVGSMQFDGGIVEEIRIGQYSPTGSIEAFSEFMVEWYQFGSGRPSPRLCMYNDSWGVFGHHQIQALIAWMSDAGVTLGSERETVTPQVFIDTLLALGFHDVTQREGNDDSAHRWTTLRTEAQRILSLPEHARLNTLTNILEDRARAYPPKFEPPPIDEGVIVDKPQVAHCKGCHKVLEDCGCLTPQGTYFPGKAVDEPRKIEALFFRLTTPPGEIDIDALSAFLLKEGGFYYMLDHSVLAFPLDLGHDDFVFPTDQGIPAEGIVGEEAARWLHTLNRDLDSWRGYRENGEGNSAWREVVTLKEVMDTLAEVSKAVGEPSVQEPRPKIGAFFWRILTPWVALGEDNEDGEATLLMMAEGAFFWAKDRSILAFPDGFGRRKRGQPGVWAQAKIEVEPITGDGADEQWVDILNQDLTAWQGYEEKGKGIAVWPEPITLAQALAAKAEVSRA